MAPAITFHPDVDLEVIIPVPGDNRTIYMVFTFALAWNLKVGRIARAVSCGRLSGGVIDSMDELAQRGSLCSSGKVPPLCREYYAYARVNVICRETRTILSLDSGSSEEVASRTNQQVQPGGTGWWQHTAGAAYCRILPWKSADRQYRLMKHRLIRLLVTPSRPLTNYQKRPADNERPVPLVLVPRHAETGHIIGLLREWVPGGCLADLDILVIPVTTKRKWVSQIRETVNKLHAIGVVWGDVKARNVVIDEADDAWLIDFGGGFTDGWVEKGLANTLEGDKQGVKKLMEFLEVKEDDLEKRHLAD
ncbi:hypothetical protein CHU98_g2259 [Xylaria longipes]|nr:hypothetical protein CHU98_g2259 [Xylaria longipes]